MKFNVQQPTQCSCSKSAAACSTCEDEPSFFIIIAKVVPMPEVRAASQSARWATPSSFICVQGRWADRGLPVKAGSVPRWHSMPAARAASLSSVASADTGRLVGCESADKPKAGDRCRPKASTAEAHAHG